MEYEKLQDTHLRILASFKSMKDAKPWFKRIEKSATEYYKALLACQNAAAEFCGTIHGLQHVCYNSNPPASNLAEGFMNFEEVAKQMETDRKDSLQILREEIILPLKNGAATDDTARLRLEKQYKQSEKHGAKEIGQATDQLIKARKKSAYVNKGIVDAQHSRDGALLDVLHQKKAFLERVQHEERRQYLVVLRGLQHMLKSFAIEHVHNMDPIKRAVTRISELSQLGHEDVTHIDRRFSRLVVANPPPRKSSGGERYLERPSPVPDRHSPRPSTRGVDNEVFDSLHAPSHHNNQRYPDGEILPLSPRSSGQREVRGSESHPVPRIVHESHLRAPPGEELPRSENPYPLAAPLRENLSVPLRENRVSVHRENRSSVHDPSSNRSSVHEPLFGRPSVQEHAPEPRRSNESHSQPLPPLPLPYDRAGHPFVPGNLVTHHVEHPPADFPNHITPVPHNHSAPVPAQSYVPSGPSDRSRNNSPRNTLQPPAPTHQVAPPTQHTPPPSYPAYIAPHPQPLTSSSHPPPLPMPLPGLHTHSTSVPPPAPSAPSLPQAKIKYDFRGTEPNHLSVSKGEVIELVGKPEENWQYGRSTASKREGWFPFSYCDPMNQHGNR